MMVLHFNVDVKLAVKVSFMSVVRSTVIEFPSSHPIGIC